MVWQLLLWVQGATGPQEMAGLPRFMARVCEGPPQIINYDLIQNTGALLQCRGNPGKAFLISEYLRVCAPRADAGGCKILCGLHTCSSKNLAPPKQTETNDMPPFNSRLVTILQGLPQRHYNWRLRRGTMDMPAPQQTFAGRVKQI